MGKTDLSCGYHMMQGRPCGQGHRGGGTGPADPASAGPIILAQLVNIHTNAHAKPYLPLVYSTLDGQFSSLEFKY